MPSNDFKYYSLSLVVFSVSLLAFNIFNWTQPPSVLAGINPHIGRNIASIEDSTTISKPRNIKVLTYDCENPQAFNTDEREVRIALHNCGGREKITAIKNAQNYFQATLFNEESFLITDYIPLVNKTNAIKVVDNTNTELKIVVYKTYNDAR